MSSLSMSSESMSSESMSSESMSSESMSSLSMSSATSVPESMSSLSMSSESMSSESMSSAEMFPDVFCRIWASVFACWRIARATIRMSRYRVRLSFAPRFVRSTFTCICGPIGMRYQVDWFALPIPSSMPTPSVSSRALTQVWF